MSTEFWIIRQALDVMINRRAFNRAAALALASPFASAQSIQGLLAQNGFGCTAPNLSSGTSRSIDDLVHVDDSTLNYRHGGLCCSHCTSFKVSHYQPTVLVEIVRGPNDSIFKGSNLAAQFAVHYSNQEENAFDVRIWEIPDYIIDGVFYFAGCKLCGTKSAESTPSAQELLLGGSCLSDNAVLRALLSRLQGLIPTCAPRLLYDSSVDFFWRSGCPVDAAKGTGPMCEMTNIGRQFGASTFLPDLCIGEWGPLYPRQMLSYHDDPRLASAVTAYRGLHLARSYGLLPYSADMNEGLLQPVFPTPGRGFSPGSTQASKEVMCNDIHKSGLYAYMWWLPVSCCKSLNEIAGLCVPEVCSQS